MARELLLEQLVEQAKEGNQALVEEMTQAVLTAGGAALDAANLFRVYCIILWQLIATRTRYTHPYNRQMTARFI